MLGQSCPNFNASNQKFGFFAKPSSNFTGTYSYIAMTSNGFTNFNATIESKFLFIMQIKHFQIVIVPDVITLVLT